jgi:putative endopeptidase
MRKLLCPLTLALVLAGLTATAANDNKSALPEVQPTSEIPARREFPVNSEVNPCEDFHKYVCSIAESRFKLRDDRSHHTFAFNDSRERLLDAKKDFMKNLPKEKKLTPRARQIKDFYMGCMDTKMRAKEEKAKLAQVEKELKRISHAKDFIKYLNAQTFDGDMNFVYFYDTPNMDDPHKLDIGLGANLMDLPDQSYYEKADLMAAYKDLFVKFFMTAEPALSKEQATAKADAQIAMQKEFAKIYPEAAIRRQRYSEKRVASQKDVLAKYPQLQLQTFLNKAPKSTLVNIPVPEGLQYINEKLNDSTLQTFKDFYLYKVGSALMDEGYPDFFQAQFDFEKKFFGGPQSRPDLQERCTSAASGTFMMELDQVLIGRLFPGFKDEKVQTLAGKIRGSIVDGLEHNTWLSPEAKAEALKKIKTARLQLVRPHTDKEWDFAPVQKYSTKMYLGNMEIRRRARLQKTIDDLHHKANQDAWGMGPLIVNAYYSENENKFVLPIGIMQYPFYDKDGDMISNLGAVGAVMGHELGHSIDDQGAKYDAEGKLRQWMSTRDLAEFSQRGQKMIDLFNKAGHNGALTQGENIADLVGLTFAYHAAFPDNKGSQEDKQRFFESYGRLWCTVDRPDFAQMLLKTDPHAAGWARINEQVKHQPGFAEAFKCKPGDKMVLSDKDRVQIW